MVISLSRYSRYGLGSVVIAIFSECCARSWHQAKRKGQKVTDSTKWCTKDTTVLVPPNVAAHRTGAFSWSGTAVGWASFGFHPSLKPQLNQLMYWSAKTLAISMTASASKAVTFWP